MVGGSRQKQKAPAGVRRLCFWSLGGKLAISTLRLAVKGGDENRVGTVEQLICFDLSLAEKQGSYLCPFSNTSAKNVRTASRRWFTATRKQAALSATAQNWLLSFRSLLCRPSLDRPSPLRDPAEAAAIPAVQGRARWAISTEFQRRTVGRHFDLPGAPVLLRNGRPITQRRTPPERTLVSTGALPALRARSTLIPFLPGWWGVGSCPAGVRLIGCGRRLILFSPKEFSL